MSIKTYRRYLWVVHLYLGVLLGGAFALLGLTGGFLIFYPEIDQFLNPALQVKNQPMNEIKVQRYFDQLHTQFPKRQGVWRLEMPRSSDQVVYARYLKPEEKDPNQFAPLVVAMHPATAEVINARFWGDYAVTWVYNLHYSLLAGKTGTVLVSLLGVVLLLSLSIGFYLWLPRGRHKLLKAVPKIRSGNQKRIYDLHGYTGAYSVCLLILLTVTGMALATPQWFEPIVYKFSDRWIKNDVSVDVPVNEAVRIGADQAIFVGLYLFPGSQLRWIDAPSNLQDPYLLRLKQVGEPSDRFPKTYVWVDPFSGQVLGVRDAMKVSSGDTFFDWLHPLHNAEAFGWIGRWVVFLVAWIPAVLWITGLIRWRQKVKAKKHIIHRKI